jgi:hypothetical protein
MDNSTMEDIVQPALAAAGTKGIAVQACDACRRLKVCCSVDPH